MGKFKVISKQNNVLEIYCLLQLYESGVFPPVAVDSLFLSY